MKAPSHILPLVRQFTVFSAIGIINTILSLIVILAVSEILHIHYVIANMTGYAFGLLSGFILHRNVTFRAEGKNKNTGKQAAAFLIVFAVAYACQLSLVVTLVERCGFNDLASQVGGWVFYVCLSFAGHKYLTFRRTKAEERDE